MSTPSKTFVILAAGRGTRMGRTGAMLHKALVPLDGRAIISHLIDLAPPDAEILICLGYHGQQVKDYVRLALDHKKHRHVGFVNVPNWDQPGGGPGASLRAALPDVHGDLIFTSCDTLWEHNPALWLTKHSWAGVAPLPAATQPERWCRLATTPNGRVHRILDKRPGANSAHVYVGLAYIKEEDHAVFADGLCNRSTFVGDELQVSGGFTNLIANGRVLDTRHVRWTDVGDEHAYRRAVAQFSGYDWTKADEATYVLPGEHRVVKYWAQSHRASNRWARGRLLGDDAVPRLLELRTGMLAYEYADGVTGYEAADAFGVYFTNALLQWRDEHLTRPVNIDLTDAIDVADRFYRVKTFERIGHLTRHLYAQALDVVQRVSWEQLCAGVKPGVFHGDFNHGNVICQYDAHDFAVGRIIGIDWREDFAGETQWGDLRYDLAKLLAGCYIHWGRARRGDFRPWDMGYAHARCVRGADDYTRDIEIIGALSLLNSAPLHASPLDEILVARGCAWLEEHV